MFRRFQALMLILMLILATCLPFAVKVTPAQTQTQPALPQVYLDTRYAVPTGRVWSVGASTNLQTVLNAAQPGDLIKVTAGITKTGNFTLPVKSGAGAIFVQTSDMLALPPEGTRVSQANAASMPKLVSPNTQPAVWTAGATKGWRFVGIEFGIASGVTTNYGIVQFGNEETSPAAQPRDLVLDRCYVHGNPAGDCSRGVALNAPYSSVIDSYVANIHGVGFDTQAVASWNSPGPNKIINNYLEASGENILVGGADPKVPGLVPSDLEIRRNTCSKPSSWNPNEASYVGQHYTVKNSFELKNARRVLVDGNIFENVWNDAQTGIAVLLTPRNQSGGSPQSVVEDVTFTNNIIRHAAGALNMLGTDNERPSGYVARILIKNNLTYDIGGQMYKGVDPYTGFEPFLALPGGQARYITIDHNTGIKAFNIISTDGQQTTGFVLTNNIFSDGGYGVHGGDVGEGNPCFNTYFPSSVVTDNVFTGRDRMIYPPNNDFPATLAGIGFVDAANGDYRLSPTSPYSGKGCDIVALNAAQSGGAVAPPSPPDATPPVIVSAGPVNMSVYGPDVAVSVNEPCRVVIEFGLTTGYGYFTSASPLGSSATISLVIFAPGSNVHYRVIATDAAGNKTTGPDQVFSTLQLSIGRNN